MADKCNRRSRALFLLWCASIRQRMSSNTCTACTRCGPLFNITHSARSPIAASVISARDGAPVFARFSNTCVAQITGTWAGQIHFDATFFSQLLLRPLQLCDHRIPGFDIVMRAVHPHAIHALGDQLPHKLVILCRFERNSHHDADAAFSRRRTQQRVGVSVQESVAFRESETGSRPVGRRPFAPGKPMEKL